MPDQKIRFFYTLFRGVSKSVRHCEPVGNYAESREQELTAGPLQYLIFREKRAEKTHGDLDEPQAF